MSSPNEESVEVSAKAKEMKKKSASLPRDLKVSFRFYFIFS